MRVSGENWSGRFEEDIDNVIEEAKAAFKANAADGEDIMRTIIATSGTPSTGRSGRVDTGKMIDGVNHRVDDETDYTLDVSFGWDEEDFAGERTPNYPVIQDGGFVHVPDASYIPGMHALQDATTEFVTQTENDVDRIFK